MKKNSEPYPIWPRPQEARFGGGALKLRPALGLAVAGDAVWLADAADSAVKLLNAAAGRTAVEPAKAARGAKLTVASMDGLPRALRLKPVTEREGYALAVSASGVVLAGADAAGVYYGAQTLAQLLAAGDGLSLPAVRVRDWPRYPVRGAHVYMPGRGQLAFFERFLDFLARYKFNTLILEVGGGMEYQRHPEVNEAWRRFCRDADGYEPLDDPGCERFKQRHPRGANAMSNSRHYWKDSTHTELGGGDCLTQSEVRRLLDACRVRHIEVIPEVQSLSHSYYLCYGHPEIAELVDDPWPDTYCPSNPKSYELLFDIMEEVIEVFQPRVMHIGHDELYHIGVCPRCRDKSGHELLAGDLRRIHAFLAARDVRPFLWGDKLMYFTNAEGKPEGGVEKDEFDAGSGKTFHMRATHKAADKVPADLLICDWYWSLDPESERHFHQHGFDVVYGNFSPLGFKDWETRANLPYVLGAEISSWCEVSAYAFGHNGVTAAFLPGADMLWRGLQMPRDEVTRVTARRLPRDLDALTGEARWLVAGGRGRVVPVDLSPASTPLAVVPMGAAEELAGRIEAKPEEATVLGSGRFKLAIDGRGVLSHGVVLGKSNPTARAIPVGRRARRLLVLHGTNMQDLFFQPTFYSYHRGPAELLHYEVRYADGRKRRFSACFGDDIGPAVGAWPTKRGGGCHRAVTVDCGNHTLFAQEWENPRPQVAIESIAIAIGRDASEVGDAVVAAISLVQ